ncbi:MAG: beta-ketoacyl-ACP synthase II, partial [Rickettsiales bacterium]|nr:beta-ketoacyl-ACP synthase II [Rickettsiales bacterium]
MGRRIVVSGIGVVSSLGNNVRDTWENILKSKSGIGKITKFPTDDFPDSISKIAGEIKIVDDSKPETKNFFDPSLFVDKKDVKKMDSFIWYGMAAAAEAVADAGWNINDEAELEKTGVLISSGIGGINSIQDTSITFREKGIRKISPFFIPQSLINLLSGHIAIKYGYHGSNFSVVSACATGNHSIGEGAEIIRRGDADVMVVGGSESSVGEICIGGFSNMRALSIKYNDNPEKASRPWDRNRDGFVMGEGAGVLILEEYEHAKRRGAKIYAELIGYGTSCDAYHITSPHFEGKGAQLAMNMALRKAEI